jgi:hypothetical protein
LRNFRALIAILKWPTPHGILWPAKHITIIANPKTMIAAIWIYKNTPIGVVSGKI